MASACLPEEELECPICLSLLRSPITTPCGHNFCRGCLQALWEAASSPPLLPCPQCRSPFDARPSALATNSLLGRVLEQVAGAREPPEGGRRAPAAAGAPVPCDACLGSPPSEATHSCLTCRASFCAQHLRPHLQSPAFRQHHRLLRPPLRDLPGKTCPEHGLLLDGYCPAPLHAALLCPDCRPRHQGPACPGPLALPQARAQKELQLKKKLTELDGLSKKALQSLDQVQVQQKQTSGIASQKLDLLKSEFLEIIALIQEEEKECVKKILAEEKRVLDKYDFVSKVLGKKKNEIQGERDQIEMVLSEDDDIAFLRKSAKLGQMQIKDVFIPKIDLDQKLIQTVFQKVFDLKETLKQYLTHPEEKKTEGSSQGKPNLQTQSSQSVKNNTSLNAPKGGSVPANSSWETSAKEATAATDTKRRSRPAKRSQSASRNERSSSRSLPRTQSETLETFLNKSREELLEFATKFSLDYNTAHEKVIISEKNTKMTVSDIPQNYSYHPHRFTYCSQVVAFQCFKKGIHYWEVEIEHSNFCGIGVCYGSMPRQGVDSRLGRNSSSWCIEWFNARISAWHNDIEECLPNTKVQKIGVLLNCKGGFVIFFGVAEKMTLLHMFQAQFTEALYPAFWIFSSGTTISISQLK